MSTASRASVGSPFSRSAAYYGLDLPTRIMRRVDAGLWVVLGTLTIGYGFVLLITLALR